MDDLIDNEWKWVEALLWEPDAPSAAALRGYLNDRITERLVYARNDERQKLADGMKAEADDFRRAIQKKERERIRGPVAQRFLDAGLGTGVSTDPALTLAVGTAIRGTLKWVLNLIDEEEE